METNATVALAAISLAGIAVACLAWVVKYFANTFSKDLREHTLAAKASTRASDKQTKASEEVLKFMKNLNGKLEGAVIAKAEQRVDEKKQRIRGKNNVNQ